MTGKPALGGGAAGSDHQKGFLHKTEALGNARSPAGGGTDQQEGFLHEIEALGKALSLDPKRPPRQPVLPPPSSDKSRSTSAGRSSSSSSFDKHKEKKKSGSLWGWNPIKKALSHIGTHRRFDCCFSLHVHSIEGLPAALAGVTLAVHWRRTTDPSSAAAVTRPARVVHGAVKFEETLTYRCSVHAGRTGPDGTAKYEARHFLVYPAPAGGAHGMDLGRFLVDVTRVLPATLEELEEEKAFGKWSTSYRLSGKARGASLNVSFGFSLVTTDSVDLGTREKVSEIVKSRDPGLNSRVGRHHQRHNRYRSMDEVKVLHEVLPSSKSDTSILPNVEMEPEMEGYRASKELSKVNVDAKPKIVAEHEESTDLKHYALLEPLEVGDKDPHQLKPLILQEPVKRSDDQESNDPEFTVIEHSVEISLDEQTCKVRTEINEITGGDRRGEAKKEEGSYMKPDGEATNESDMKPNEPDATEVKLDELDVEEIKHENFSPQGAILLASETTEEQGVHINPDELVAKEAWHDTDNMQEATLASLDSVVERHNMQDATLFSLDPAMEDLDSILDSLSVLKSDEFESPDIQGKTNKQLSHEGIMSDYNIASLNRSQSLDAAAESVASEFLSMLGIEHSPFGLSSDSDPDSPRERLWKQFQKESLVLGDDLFGLDTGMEKQSYCDEFSDGFDLSSIVQEAETELQMSQLAMDSKSKAKMLEDAETEALMREWGLNEKVFHCSPPGSRNGFGSPIDLPPEEPLELPPLGEGLGPIVQTKDGGFLRSMNPTLFRNAKNNGNLIMQVSNPVVVPAEMGSGIMEILQQLASEGIEKLSRQASKLMPLEDITGKTMQHIAWDSATALDSCKSHDLLENHYPDIELGASQSISGRKKGSVSLGSSSGGEMMSEYVSLEDLAPMAMDKIEALSMEGLRIQTGLSDEEAPSNIAAQSIGEISALEGKGAKNSWSLGLEGTAGLQLLDVKDSEDDVDGLMGLSITLDEWMKLDSGIIDEEDQISDRTSKILAAHHANSMDLISGGWKGDKRGKKSGKKWGLLGNNFTVALMVQLRNPLRNYEPVGTPMLALIQVERVFVPPKPKIYSSVSEKGNNEQEDEVETESKPLAKVKYEEEEVIPQFKITEVHVAGLKTESNKNSIWGNPKQQQSGSRWLLATGMGKANKHPFMKSKAVAKPSQERTAKVQPGDTLWSISSRAHGTGAKWQELAALNPHIRNPNVIFPNETIRLR
ncbi:hypothetical protein Cni_G07327 [Canna indica]|uniref:Protein PLASTID MOVEMENT IMPAIRED 1-RELATED 1 n=1 Tax=Canna indica TaxID=4628 RepID=A0AAQ3K3M4_9LILI|nr:hypothetical protein Cni_G07327 [Canna indica]